MTTALLVKLATPFVAAAVTGGIKAALNRYGKVLPSWLTPLLAALVGAAQGAITGDPSALGDAIAEGAALGGGAPAVREIYRKAVPQEV